MKGQLSAEMLILIAVIIAVVAIAATRLIDTAQDSSESIDTQSEQMLDKTKHAVRGKAGDFCTVDEDCISESCNVGEYVCT
jgi:uncharacterized protein (UPF0333 family)